MLREIVGFVGADCTGCGLCITECPNEALHTVNGRSRLAGEAFCEGCGLCVEVCRHGAASLERREAAPFDAAATKKRLALRQRMRELAGA
ncbi:MAG: 4Fe-4S binding protein [Anaeromyxobacteraceae bacterium]